ncbi:hypothetical protein LCGC14_0814990 [marine sediment metagenome]|uniref:Uncharacterized protein n=1 Tax=marine sediment metagenome TaxID=412755 RepID=A0A0F9PQ78_9ZZZZ
MKEVLLYKADDGTVFSTAKEAFRRDRKDKKETEEGLADRANWLTSKLRYEFSGGIHTGKKCGCGERVCRSKCFMCLIKEFIDESN